MNPIRLFLFGAVCLLSLAASAQWQWTDKEGRKVFSDRAPPPDILEKNIVKRPGGQSASTGRGVVSDNQAIPVAAGVSAPKNLANSRQPSGVDKELTEKKKMAEEAEVTQRKAEEERVQKAKMENCTRAKQAKANFDSGARISRLNEKGEREMMDNAARSAETNRIQSIMDADCK